MKRSIAYITLITISIIWSRGEAIGQSWAVKMDITGHKTEVIDHMAIDSLKAIAYINDYTAKINAQGKLKAVLDSIYCRNNQCSAKIYVVKPLTTKAIKLDSAASIALDGQKLPSFIDSSTYRSLIRQVASFYAQRGYPFVNVKVDSTSINSDNEWKAIITVNKGDQFLYDSIANKSNLKINPNIYNKLIGIKSGTLYNHKEATDVGRRLSQLPYTKAIKPHDIRFVNGQAHVYTYLEKQVASRFDLLLGILPQESTEGRSWKISGDVLIEMHNALQYGEYLFGQYKGLPNGNTEVLIKSTVPYLGVLPVGSHMDFRLFRNGDQHIDVYFDGGAQYLFGSLNNVKMLYNNRSSSLINIDTAAIKSRGKLPQRLDTKYNGVGMAVDIRKVDYRLNPSKGFTILSSLSVGSRQINKNNTITNIVGFENAYDSLSRPTLQAEGFLGVACHHRIKDWASIKVASTSSIRYNKSKLQLNEYYRIGGSRTLRGFDEESILTNAYSYLTAEFRFVFDRNSYLSLPFIDVGYTSIDIDGVQTWDRVFGVGLGINFATQAGIFNTSIAAGSAQSQPIDFSKLKIHMGYVSLF